MEEKDFEIWADIPGYSGLYQCSNHGNIRSLERIVTYSSGQRQFYPSQLKRQRVNRANDYFRVTLSKRSVKTSFDVHALVGLLFVPGYQIGLVLNHKDGCKWNNYYKNLEWITQKENDNHAREVLKVGRHSYKPVFCLMTGDKYESLTDAYAAKGYTFGITHLGEMLKGIRKNKSTLSYVQSN